MPMTNVVGRHAQHAPQRGMTRRILLVLVTTAALFRMENWAGLGALGAREWAASGDMNPLKFFAAIGITTTGCSTQTTARSRNLYPLNA